MLANFKKIGVAAAVSTAIGASGAAQELTQTNYNGSCDPQEQGLGQEQRQPQDTVIDVALDHS